MDDFKHEGDLLLVDGDQTAREETAAILKKAGFTVTQAHDGNQAIKTLERQSWRWNPRFIIIDTLLTGLSSFELVRRLHSKFEKKETILVMMSKYKSPEDFAEASTAGAAGFIIKPFQMESLEDIYKKTIERRLKQERSTQGLQIN